MDPNYEFDAPMYVDFQNGLPDDGVDSWFDSRAGDEGGIVMEDDSLEETSGEEHIQTEMFVAHDKSKSEETVKTCQNTAAAPSAEQTLKDSVNENENLPDTSKIKKTVDQAPEIVKPVRNLPNICASTEEWRQRTKTMRRVGGSNQPLKANHSLQKKQTVKRKQVDEQQKEKQASKLEATTKKCNDLGNRPVLRPRRSACISHKRDPSPCTNSRKRDPSPCTSSRKRDPSPCTSSRKHDPSPCISSRKRDPSPCTSSRKHDPSPCTSSRKRDPSPCTSSRKRDPSPCISSKKRDPSPCPSQRGRQPSPTPKSRSCQPSPCSASHSGQLSTSSNTSVSSSSVSPPKKRKISNANKPLTVPTSPSMMRRANNKPVNISHKSKEDEELEVIAKKQKETKKKIEKNEQYMKKALSAQPYMPHRSVEDNFTFPEAFHFATDERIKSAPKQEEKRKDFAETLRKHPQSPTFKSRGPTIPVPFHFHASSSDSYKRKLEEEEDKATNSYLTMAQLVYNFQSNTPERFRTKSVKDQNEGPEVVQNKAPLKLTNPKTPKLITKERKRPVPDDVLSRDQEEEKIAEEMKNYKFKATKFDPRIIETNGCYGIKTVPKKPLTEPQPFSFEYDQRAEQYKQKEQMRADEPRPEPFKANPVPDYDKVAFKPELKHKATDAEPFSFEERNKEMLVKKEQKIQAIIQEEKNKANEFEAQPLPEFSPPKLRSSTKVLTEPAPFHLSCDYKGAAKAEKWMQKVRDELKDQRMKAVFKAHPSNILYNAPFVPKKSLKPCTEFEEFDLNTERRREAREIYEMAKKEQAIAAEAEALQREKEREEEERLNLIQLRKQLVHKPNPIRKFKGVKVQPSQQPLTVPESPDWSESSRKKMRL